MGKFTNYIMSEKVVYVRRLPISNSEKGTKDEEVVNYFNQGKRSIGAFMVRDSVRPGTGLRLPEENLLMPLILDIDPSDRGFRAAVSRFFHDISLKVPPLDAGKDVGGLPLRISLEDDTQALGANLGTKENPRPNLPFYPVEYVKWKFCIAHPSVGVSQEESRGDILKEFYLHDEVDVKGNKDKKREIADEAMTTYLRVKDDDEKVRQLLIMLDIPREDYTGKEQELLRLQAELRPADFLRLNKSKQLGNISLLRELLEAGVLVRAGDRFLYKETKTLFAIDNNEAVGFIQDPKNSEEVLAFKSRVHEFRKAIEQK